MIVKIEFLGYPELKKGVFLQNDRLYAILGEQTTQTISNKCSTNISTGQYRCSRSIFEKCQKSTTFCGKKYSEIGLSFLKDYLACTVEIRKLVQSLFKK